MKTIGVLTSGGDSPGMNAAIRAVARGSLYHNRKVYGIHRGYEGLIEEDFHEMKVSSVSDIIQRGGTILRTARSEAFMTPDGFQRALDVLMSFEVEGLVIIDNDLAYTEFTIGFDTAVNTVLSSIGAQGHVVFPQPEYSC